MVVFRTQQRRKSSEGDEQGENDEKETVSGEIGESGDKHSKGEGDSPRWDGEELSPDCTVTEGLDDSGREVGVGVSGDDESEVHETASDDTD